MDAQKSLKWFLLPVVGIWGARLWSMHVLPLMDTTEARYGEIARLMAETGDWITPQHDYGAWYWGKPPLSTWLSALSIKMFGLSELAVRSPSLVLAAGVLWLTYRIGEDRLSQRTRLWAISILSSSTLFLVASGAVMTDVSLCLCASLSMTAFWVAVETRSRPWGYLFFIGLGLGLLAKGPVVLALTGLPIGVWLFWNGSWREGCRLLPWFSGTLLMLGIALPWYLAAELKTPGFLEYFLLGENIKRFLLPGWPGDLYGFAHRSPLGIVWIYLLGAALPWSLVWIGLFIRSGGRRSLEILNHTGQSPWRRYLWAWALAPMLFFSFSRHVIWTYCLPSLPPLALLLAAILDRPAPSDEGGGIRRRVGTKYLAVTAMAPAALLLSFCIAESVHPEVLKQSTKPIALRYLALPAQGQKPLAYVGKRLFSLEYYTRGRAKSFKDMSSALRFAEANGSGYVMVNRNRCRSWEDSSSLHADFQFGPYVLMKIDAPGSAPSAIPSGQSDPAAATIGVPVGACAQRPVSGRPGEGE